MRNSTLLLLLLPLVLAPGCPVRRFEVVMERAPDGTVQRELTVWTADAAGGGADGKGISEPQADVLAAARSAYGETGRGVGKKQRFSGVFAKTLPADLIHGGLTNHGLFGSRASRMGNVFTYVERLPGQSNLLGLFRRGEEIADTLVSALRAWARQQSELQSEPTKLEKLETFLKTEFRDDVLNALLMGWQTITRLNALEDGGFPPDDSAEETLRFLNYLVERGYLRPNDVTLAHKELPLAVHRGVLRKAADAMGYRPPEPLPAPLDKLADPNELNAAFEEGLKAVGLTPDKFSALIEPALPTILGSDTKGRVVWRCQAKPTCTNGAWEPQKERLCWDAEGRQGCESPQILFAIWAEPDQPFQRAHLGRVMLSGDSLVEYVSWRAGLTAERRAEWDVFVDGLRPGPDVFDRLKRFRFRGPTTMPTSTPTTQAEDDLTRGAELILGQ